MFGSAMLEVAIGLVFVFMLVSIMMTALQEAIEGFLRQRASDLESAIMQIMQGDQATLDIFYSHPLVYALYRGDPANAATRKPAYIPRDVFSAALLDMVSRDQLPDNLVRAYDGLNRVSGGDLAKLRKELENWYDATMDRASGWFRRRSQIRLFWMGLAVAVVLNINAVTIAQYLNVNDAERAALADYAEDVANTLKEQQAANGAEASNAVEPDNAAIADNAVADNAAIAPNAAAPATPAPSPGRVGMTDAQLKESYAKLVNMGMPIGWSEETLRWMPPFRGDATCQLSQNRCGLTGFMNWVMLIAGYLITALATMLGAPFWFDLLNKLVVIRSTVKPKEKSPDEPSADGGRGGPIGGNPLFLPEGVQQAELPMQAPVPMAPRPRSKGGARKKDEPKA